MADQSRRGRPRGAANVEYAEVKRIPELCPKCGGADLKKVPGSKVIERKIPGVLRGGFRYQTVRHARKRCECGQNVIVKTYYPGKLKSETDYPDAG